MGDPVAAPARHPGDLPDHLPVAGVTGAASRTPPDRHDIEVFVDGAWAPGELRRVKVVDGVEVHTVRYVDPDGQPHVSNFPAGLVRPDETGTEPAR